jgi:hypothetical protein
MSAQLRLPREPMKLDETVIQRPKDILRAFVLQAELGGLDDQQAAAAAGMDPSSWSQFKNGTRGIKPLELKTFDNECGNQLVLAYWAWSSGFVLTPRESELERRLRLKDEQVKKLQDENRLLREIAVGKAA